MSKIFVIGLPRTGTTSVCAALLSMGYKVCHTAYTDAAFEVADVVADTPAYAFYPELDTRFPGSKFIYIHRNETEWIPSIKAVLCRIKERYKKNPHAFHPLFIRCMHQTFSGFFAEDDLSDSCLKSYYERHSEQVMAFFNARPQQFLKIVLKDGESFEKLLTFLSIGERDIHEFPKLNQQGNISDWEKISSPLKISSHFSREDGRRSLTLF